MILAYKLTFIKKNNLIKLLYLLVQSKHSVVVAEKIKQWIISEYNPMWSSNLILEDYNQSNKLTDLNLKDVE